ncbi:hypothetical protein C8R45DRAFT_335057 [Mycena sanguinolenta]|nr:hypothetical protein C8R45DRAFT_335057 [Mycena sanguinolenta]
MQLDLPLPSMICSGSMPTRTNWVLRIFLLQFRIVCIQAATQIPLENHLLLRGDYTPYAEGFFQYFPNQLIVVVACRTRYYNNYFIHEASGPESRRQYYSEEVPTFIHVHETSYVDVDLCKYFSMEMALAHGTCSGIAKVYNQALGVSQLPNSSRLSHDLTGDLVLDSFIHYSILQDKKIRRETLSLPHGGHQNHRYDEAMAERNYRMAGTGQPMWAHSCNRCMKLYKGGDGQWYRLTAGVHDGVTVRHLCCSVHNCLEALQSQLHHFCFTHRDLAKICCMHTVLSKWLPKKGIPQCFSCAGVCEKQLQLRLQKLL